MVIKFEQSKDINNCDTLPSVLISPPNLGNLKVPGP